MFVLMRACHLLAQSEGPHHVGNSPRAFIEEFYSWYVPRAVSDDTTVGWNNTLKSIHSDLSPQLAKLLEEDSAAQAKCEELVGLNFDPFLYAQEPVKQYQIERITQAGDHYRADIYRGESGERSKTPDVIAEFAWKDGRWFFVNFYYPNTKYPNTNLLAILKSRPKCSKPRVP